MSTSHLKIEQLIRRIESISADIADLEIAFERFSVIEQRLAVIESVAEGNARTLKSRIHRNHDKRMLARDLHDSAIESETLQKVASRLGQEFDKVFGEGNRRGIDALTAVADAALQEERWIRLRRSVEFIYSAWGLVCLYFCLFLVRIFPFLAPRFGFLPASSPSAARAAHPEASRHSGPSSDQ